MKRFLSILLAVLLLLTAAMPVLGEELKLTPEEIEAIFGDPDYFADTAKDEAEFDNGTAFGAADDLTPEEQAALDAIAATLGEEEEGEPDVSDLEISDKLPDNVVNILLLGIDNRTVELETGRSDAMIICSINTDTGSVKLTSFARDLAVVIPGYKNRCPINNAFKYGSRNGDVVKGAKLAVRTVNHNFGMNIKYYVVVNIYGLAAIIEAIGGVDMEMTKAEANLINYELFVKEPMNKDGVKHTKLEERDGVQHLDGMQATTYGRIRNLKGQNDINRNGRQREMMSAVIAKVMDGMDFMSLLKLVETALPYGLTNLTTGEIASLGMAVLSGDTMKNLSSSGMEAVGSFGIPMIGEYGYKTFNDKSCVYISDRRMDLTMGEWFNFLFDGDFPYVK